MRIYISGPMTGILDGNREAFAKEAELWRSRGHFVVNPHDITAVFGTVDEITIAFGHVYGMFPLDTTEEKKAMTRLANSVMEADIAALRSCDTIVMLRGWQSSRGAKKELEVALRHGLKVMLQEDRP